MVDRWRNVVAPATHFVVGTYLCTSVECLTVDLASTTSLLSWGFKIFITVFGLFGAYLVRRWSWFQSHYEEEEDEFQRLERVEHKPWRYVKCVFVVAYLLVVLVVSLPMHLPIPTTM